jgi:Ca2+-binding RTX toxin-like protein
VIRALAAAAAVGLVAASVAGAVTLRGTAKDDRLVGTGKADTLKGRGGDDRLRGRKRGDLLVGGGGNDRLKGGPGGDDLLAGDGNDKLRDGTGFDIVDAGPGDDYVFSQNGRGDQIDCGEGVDTAVLDETEDGVFDCEILQAAPEPEPEPAPESG